MRVRAQIVEVQGRLSFSPGGRRHRETIISGDFLQSLRPQILPEDKTKEVIKVIIWRDAGTSNIPGTIAPCNYLEAFPGRVITHVAASACFPGVTTATLAFLLRLAKNRRDLGWEQRAETPGECCRIQNSRLHWLIFSSRLLLWRELSNGDQLELNSQVWLLFASPVDVSVCRRRLHERWLCYTALLPSLEGCGL